MQQVIATGTGYDGKVVRQEGEEFEMPDGAKGSWFTEAVPAPKRKSKAEVAPADDSQA